QLYDALKALAVVNWINGHDHAGNGSPGTPAIFGMNFQAVSTAQKLNKSNYYADPSNPATLIANGLGGYINDAPGPVLQSALASVDDKLTAMVNALDRKNTVII